MSTFMFDAISFVQYRKNRVELGSPCVTAMFDFKNLMFALYALYKI